MARFAFVFLAFAFGLLPALAQEPVFPARAGGLARITRVDYEARAPGLGFSIRYADGTRKADVYIYDKGMVLRDGDRAVFEDERDHAVGDIELLAQRGNYEEAEILARATRPLLGTPFATARARIVDRGVGLDSFVYVTIRNGKFLKVRYSAPARPDTQARADAFVTGLLKAQR
jgi:hypothetical protein